MTAASGGTNRWQALLEQNIEFARAASPIAPRGRLAKAAGLVMEATGLQLPVGSILRVSQRPGDPAAASVQAEVVGFADSRLYLMPTGETLGLSPGASVVPDERPVTAPVLGQSSHPWRRASDRMRHLPLGDGLIGRVVDAGGQPLDRLGALTGVADAPINRRPINAMERDPIREPLDTGVRVINSLLTVGRGQRLGLFAGPGVGKSVLMGMMARYTSADVTVVGLVGERGREVKEFIEDILGTEGMKRAVVVAAPADTPALLRMQGAAYATAIAEHFRDQGKQVLLLMDSLTRYAMAAREVALAIGEPPATRGYPPSVFARLPILLERAGNGRNGHGSITAFYTVLAEGDDQNDPVADAARAILDGHIVLTRQLADSGHYPAVDIEQSISRVMINVTSERQRLLARQIRAVWSRYQGSRDLIAVGAYVAGSDPLIDQAIVQFPAITAFLQQDVRDQAAMAASLASLEALAGPLLDGPVR